MGQGQTQGRNKNILALGIQNLIEIDYLEASWKKDERNSSSDFSLYINESTEKILLWNPEPSPIIRKIIESLIYQILFEGVIVIYKDSKVGEKIDPIRQLIHWIMSEDTMRVSAITIIIMIPSKDNPNAEPIDQELMKAKFHKEFDMDSFDSKQPRTLKLLDQNELEDLDEAKRKDYFQFTLIAEALIKAREMSK